MSTSATMDFRDVLDGRFGSAMSSPLATLRLGLVRTQVAGQQLQERPLQALRLGGGAGTHVPSSLPPCQATTTSGESQTLLQALETGCPMPPVKCERRGNFSTGAREDAGYSVGEESACALTFASSLSHHQLFDTSMHGPPTEMQAGRMDAAQLRNLLGKSSSQGEPVFCLGDSDDVQARSADHADRTDRTDRRMKNRESQRKYRERQKSGVSALHQQIKQQQAQIQRLTATVQEHDAVTSMHEKEKRMAQHHNVMLLERIKELELQLQLQGSCRPAPSMELTALLGQNRDILPAGIAAAMMQQATHPAHGVQVHPPWGTAAADSAMLKSGSMCNYYLGHYRDGLHS